MKSTFLCPNHRQQLIADPNQAKRNWQTAYDTGQSYLDSDFKYEALIHLGNAFEIAEIILTSNCHDHFESVAILTSTTATFARCLLELNHHRQSDDIIRLTVERLYKEMQSRPQLAGFIDNQITSMCFFIFDSDIAELSNDLDELFVIQNFTRQNHVANWH